LFIDIANTRHNWERKRS